MFYYLQSIAKCYDGENCRYIRRGLAVPITKELAEMLVAEMHQGSHSNFIETGFSRYSFDKEDLEEMEKKYKEALDNDEPTDDISNPFRYTLTAEMIVFQSEEELKCNNENDIEKKIIGGYQFNML